MKIVIDFSYTLINLKSLNTKNIFIPKKIYSIHIEKNQKQIINYNYIYNFFKFH